MACDVIRRPLQNFTYKHIVRLRDDATYSLGVSFFILLKFQVQLIIFVHTDDGGVEALLFAVKRLTTAVCVYPVAKCGEKSYTTVIV